MTFVKKPFDQAKPCVRDLVERTRQILKSGEYLPPLRLLGKPFGYRTRQAVGRILLRHLSPGEIEALEEIRARQKYEEKEARRSRPKVPKVMDRAAAIATKKARYGDDYFQKLGVRGGTARARSLRAGHLHNIPDTESNKAWNQ